MAVELLPNAAFPRYRDDMTGTARMTLYAKTRSNPYRISYEDVCKEVMGAKQKAQLRRMVDFKFTRHPSLNLPEQRLTAIEKQLGERTRELLSIPVQRSTKRKNEPEG